MKMKGPSKLKSEILPPAAPKPAKITPAAKKTAEKEAAKQAAEAAKARKAQHKLEDAAKREAEQDQADVNLLNLHCSRLLQALLLCGNTIF